MGLNEGGQVLITTDGEVKIVKVGFILQLDLTAVFWPELALGYWWHVLVLYHYALIKYRAGYVKLEGLY